MIVNVTRNADILAPGGVCLMLAQDFGDARHFAGADEQIDFRQFGGELVRIALGKASGDNEFFYLPRFFESADIEDGIDGFFFGGADKAAGIDQDNVGDRSGSCTISKLFLCSSPAMTSESTRLRAHPRLTMLNFCLLSLIALVQPHRRLSESAPEIKNPLIRRLCAWRKSARSSDCSPHRARLPRGYRRMSC